MTPGLSTLRGDIFGGITAAVVALPLALAFGVASGVGAIAGLYGAIAVGFFAAVFGGTSSQVSGPTGPMTVVMGAVVAEHAANLPQAFAIVMLGGLLQIAFGLLKVGRYVSYTPYSVVSGFMSGIGVIIIIIQTQPFAGLPALPGGPVAALDAWLTGPGTLNFQAVAIAGVALAIMIFWPRRLHAVSPPPLVALVAGTLLGLFLLSGAPVIGEVPTGLPAVALPLFSPSELPSIVQPAIILALLGSIDSLLTSLVADSITHTRHNSNRELIGQGIGNMVAGLIGGLPGAGATMRTVVNVRAGGRTRLSGALHALILLALVLGLAPSAENIPLAVLAGILMKVGWDIIDWGYIKRCHRAPKAKVMVMVVTLALTVFVDLVTAIAVGFILNGFVTAQWMEEEELKGVSSIALTEKELVLSDAERDALHGHEGKIGLVHLGGRFSFASARELSRRADPAQLHVRAVIYDFGEAAHIDASAAMAVEELLVSSKDDGVLCYFIGLSGEAEQSLAEWAILDDVPDGHILPTLLDALKAAAKEMDGDG